MRTKEFKGIKGIHSRKSKIFLVDYQNQVIAESNDLEDLRNELNTPKVIKTLEALKLEVSEAKLIWLTNDNLFVLDGFQDIFKDLLFLKNTKGDIITYGDYKHIDKLLKQKEGPKQFLRASFSPYNTI